MSQSTGHSVYTNFTYRHVSTYVVYTQPGQADLNDGTVSQSVSQSVSRWQKQRSSYSYKESYIATSDVKLKSDQSDTAGKFQRMIKQSFVIFKAINICSMLWPSKRRRCQLAVPCKLTLQQFVLYIIYYYSQNLGYIAIQPIVVLAALHVYIVRTTTQSVRPSAMARIPQLSVYRREEHFHVVRGFTSPDRQTIHTNRQTDRIQLVKAC